MLSLHIIIIIITLITTIQIFLSLNFKSDTYVKVAIITAPLYQKQGQNSENSQNSGRTKLPYRLYVE